MFRVEVSLNQVIDKTARGMDKIRVECACGDYLLHFCDDQFGSHCRCLVEVVLGHTVLQVADGIGPPGPDHGNVGAQRRDEHHFPAVNLPCLAAFRQRRTGGGGCEKAPQAGAAGADGLGQRTLGQEFEFDFPGLCRRNGFRVAGEERPYDFPELPLAQAAAPGQSGFAYVVADISESGQFGCGDGMHDVGRVARHAETADDQHVAGAHHGGSLFQGDLRYGSHNTYII